MRFSFEQRGYTCCLLSLHKHDKILISNATKESITNKICENDFLQKLYMHILRVSSCFHNSHFCFIYCRKKFVQTKLWSFQNNEFNLLEQIVLLLHYSIKMKDKQFNAASVGCNHVLFVVHIAIGWIFTMCALIFLV